MSITHRPAIEASLGFGRMPESFVRIEPFAAIEFDVGALWLDSRIGAILNAVEVTRFK